MSKIPSTERKECLTKKKFEQQPTNNPKSRIGILMTVEGQRCVEENALSVSHPSKIQKQGKGLWQIPTDVQMMIIEEGNAEGESFPMKDSSHP